MTILVVAEYEAGAVAPATLNTVAAAAKIGGDVHVLVAGQNVGGVAESAAKIAGVAKVLVADNAAYAHALPENVAPLVVWLGSELSGDVTGQIIESQGGRLSLGDGWRTGVTRDKGAQWQPEEVGVALGQILAEAPAPQRVWGS